MGLALSLKDGSLNLSNMWTRRLSETASGNVRALFQLTIFLFFIFAFCLFFFCFGFVLYLVTSVIGDYAWLICKMEAFSCRHNMCLMHPNYVCTRIVFHLYTEIPNLFMSICIFFFLLFLWEEVNQKTKKASKSFRNMSWTQLVNVFWTIKKYSFGLYICIFVFGDYLLLTDRACSGLWFIYCDRMGQERREIICFWTAEGTFMFGSSKSVEYHGNMQLWKPLS